MSETIIISREIATVYVKVQSAVFAVAPRPAAVIYANRQGLRGAGGYIDVEVSDATTVQSGRSYRTNSISRIPLNVLTSLLEGSYFRVIGVGMGGWEAQFNDTELAKLGQNQTSVAGRVYSQYPNDIAEFFKVSNDTWVVNSYSCGLE